MQEEIDQLKIEIDKIKLRNKNVEADKAWEKSSTRRLFLTIFTYLAIGVYLVIIHVKNPWLNAIVPAVAFLLSTLTLGYFKSLWIKLIYKK